MTEIKYIVRKLHSGVNLRLSIAAITIINGLKFESGSQEMNDNQIQNFLRDHCTKEGLIELLQNRRTIGHYGLYFIEG